MRNGFGLYKEPTEHRNKIVKDFFKDLLENTKEKYAIAKVEVEEFAKNGADRKKAPAWDFMSRCHCLIKRLESNKSRNEIAKEIIQEITDNAFIDEKLDCNLNLLGFENGVLDFSHGKPTFRKAKADEYVSMSCGYDFKWLSEKECEEWLEILRTLYQTDEEMEYDLKEISRSLVGRNREEIAKFNQGPGGNGKSFKADLIQAVLGDYCGVLNKNVLLESKYKQKNGHDISLWTNRKKRRWIVSELNESDKLDIAEFQKFTGGDKFDVRTHHQTEMKYITAPPIEFSANFVINMGNHGKQRSMARRVVCLEHTKLFVTKDEYNRADAAVRKKMAIKDTTLKDKVQSDGVKCIMMNILLTHYAKYKKEGLIKPKVSLNRQTNI